MNKHEVFDTYTDGSQVRMTCTDCNEGHTFKSAYFARDWANHHAYGIVFGPIRGLA